VGRKIGKEDFVVSGLRDYQQNRMQDPRLVTRLRQGDIGALKRLFKSNHTVLYPLVYRLTRSRDAADAIIRSAFRQLWTDRKELEPLEVLFLRLLGYAYAFATEYRSANNITGIESGARTSAGEEIASQLSKLPEEERLVYLLHIVDGYSIRELSKAFDTTEDHIREVVGSALVALNREFETEREGPVESSSPGQLWP